MENKYGRATAGVGGNYGQQQTKSQLSTIGKQVIKNSSATKYSSPNKSGGSANKYSSPSKSGSSNKCSSPTKGEVDRTVRKSTNHVDAYSKQILQNAQRSEFQRFTMPPRHLQKEFPECSASKDSSDYVPIIGIITQRNIRSNYDHYVLEANDNFNKWSGMRTIAIPYDVPEEQLEKLLFNINGVHLTGGTLELIDSNGKQNPYYVTAKRCIEFSKMMKDKYSIDWPVLGICQGLEVVAVVQGNDEIRTLDDIVANGKRTVEWCANSKIFAGIPAQLKSSMAKYPKALHYHNYAVSVKTYQRTPGLRDEFEITQKDTEDGVEYICSMDHKTYPIFTIMYHPEYQMRTDDQVQAEYAFRLSKNFREQAQLNNMKWSLGDDLLIKMTVARVAPITGRYGGLIYVYNNQDMLLEI